MKTLVLGGCGFIGSHLVDALLQAGHKVSVYDRAPELYRAPLPQVDYHFGDFLDTAMLAETLEGVDVVYHLISTTVPSTSNLNPIADVHNNLIGTLQLLDLMVQKKITKIVYLSSGGTVYGIPQTSLIAESHPLNPICSYGVVKVAVENYLQMYHHLHGIQPIVLRVSNPYGERQGHLGVQGVIGTFLGKALRDEPIEIWGDGGVVRDFIYVGDLAKLCAICAENAAIGVYNVGSGKGVSINEIVVATSCVVGRELMPIYKPSRTFDVPCVVLDISRVVAVFQWRPEVEVNLGMRITWNWIAA